MKKLTDKQVEAIELRKKGLPLKEISKKIGVAKSSVSVWTRGIDVSVDTSHFSFQGGKIRKEKAEMQRIRYQSMGRNLAALNEPLHIKGCFLYWGEGEKNKNQCSLVNTDSNLLRVFVTFIKHYFPEKNLKIEIFSYMNNNLSEDEIKNFWTESLGITDVRRFVKYNAPRGKEGKHTHPYGMCKVIVSKSTDVVQHIFGAIQQYGSFDNDYWLY